MKEWGIDFSELAQWDFYSTNDLEPEMEAMRSTKIGGISSGCECNFFKQKS